MKRVVLWVCALMMTLIASVCVAGAYSPYFTTEPPREVREHVASRWPDYEFEDYCEVRGTPKGDYGFALVHRKSERILVGYHKVDGEMKYWLKNAGAVPQGKEEAWFGVGTAGWEEETDWVGNFTGRQVYDDGLYFSVTQLDDAGESYEKMVVYRWENGMFRLSRYRKTEVRGIRVSDDKLDFIDWSNCVYCGAVQGAVQRDIRYVSFNALPTWIDDAKEKLTTAPNLQSGDFSAQKVKFTGGQKYPVYTGPGENYAQRQRKGPGQHERLDRGLWAEGRLDSDSIQHFQRPLPLWLDREKRPAEGNDRAGAEFPRRAGGSIRGVQPGFLPDG